MHHECGSVGARFPNAGQAILLVVVTLVLQSGLGFTLAFAVMILGNSPDAASDLALNPWVLGPLNIVAIGAALVVGLRVTREDPRRFFAVRRFDLSLLPAIILTSLALAVVMDKVAKHFFEFTRLFPQWAVEDLARSSWRRTRWAGSCSW